MLFELLQRGYKSPRIYFLLKKLVEHIHQFAKETQLSHEEWMIAIEFLTRAGEITDKERNEFVLLSDTMGLSSLIDMIGSQHSGTSSSVLGPFHKQCSKFSRWEEIWSKKMKENV